MFKKFIYGIAAFMIVLLLMPIGHALMVLNEKLLTNHMFLGAFCIGILGFIALQIGVRFNQKKGLATLLGLLGGILVWTGWVEFSFVWIAHKLEVQPLIENGEISTKPEYLVMLSSLGLLVSMLTYFVFSKTRCQFFNWIQQNLLRIQVKQNTDSSKKPLALTTFIETVMILWTFYLVLLLVYDKDIAGDKHPLTYLVAFGSLFWSMYLVLNLLKINKFDYAIRYAVPTVIIFWNFVEILGRWNLFTEIWVQPKDYWLENTIIFLCLVGFISYYIYENLQAKKLQKNK